MHHKHHPSYAVGMFEPSTKFSWFIKPVENWSTKINWLGINTFGERFANKEADQIWSHIRTQLSRDVPAHILLVLQGQTSFKIALHLLEESIEFYTLNWDPWIWWGRANKVPKKFDKEVEKIFARLNFKKHLVPTGEFAARYEIPNTNATVLYPYIPKLGPSKEELNSIDLSDGDINLVYAGQIYAPNEFDNLLTKLDAIRWTVNKKRVKLHYFGNGNPPKHRNLIHHGFIDPDALVEQLSLFDIGILAYPHTYSLPEVAQLSFPSKYATYVAADLPTIYLGPNNTPVCKMIGEDLGRSLDYESLDISVVLQDILFREVEIKERINQRYKKFFSRVAFEETLNSVFPIPDNAKLPVQFYKKVDLLETKKVNITNHSYTFNAITSPRTLSKWTAQKFRFAGAWRRLKTLYFFMKMLSKNVIRKFISE